MILLLSFRVTARARLGKPKSAPARYYPRTMPEHDPLTCPRTEYPRGPPA